MNCPTSDLWPFSQSKFFSFHVSKPTHLADSCLTVVTGKMVRNLCFSISLHISLLLFLQNESSTSVDADIQREYSRQREHLERSVASLRKKLEKDNEIHRADNVRIMQVGRLLLHSA